ncbi:rnhA, partial [Mucuna pruriens]
MSYLNSISFSKRRHIKAQMLADFVNKLSPTYNEGQIEERRREWALSVDRASNQKLSGVGIILEGPGGVLVEQSLHFNFKASNNQVEYKAFLAGMRLAGEVGAKVLVSNSDSQLMTEQVKGEYQAKDLQLAKYWNRAKSQVATFEKFTLIHVPHKQNERADLLYPHSANYRSNKVLCIDRQQSWMDPIVDFLQDNQISQDHQEAKHSFFYPLLKCLGGKEVQHAMREIHEGRVRYISEEGPLQARSHRLHLRRLKMSLSPSICQKMQQMSMPCKPTQSTTRTTPFIFILLPIPYVKFLLVVVDYFTKQVEVELIMTISLESVESANKVILRGLQRRLEEAKGRSVEQLPQVLWSYHTTPYSTTQEILFQLTFGKDAMILVEIEEPSLRTTFFQSANIEEVLREEHEVVHIQEYATKSKASKRYNVVVLPRAFQKSGLVLRRTTRDATSNKLTSN